MKTGKIFWTIFFGLILFFAISVTFYAKKLLTPYLANQTGLSAMESNSRVSVSSQKYGWDFTPKGNIKGGFAFYPGGLVRPEAYAPVMQKIAEKGYLVSLLRLRFNLAVTEPGKARQPIELHPDLKWAVGGHSLGGVMASSLAETSPTKVGALVLFASYPQRSMADSKVATIALFGSKDNLAPKSSVDQEEHQLPASAEIVMLEGLNHSGFGSYGQQKGDEPSDLKPQEGFSKIADLTVKFLDQNIKP